MRKHKSEAELRQIAEANTQTIVIRTYVDGCSRDERRPCTALEHTVLYSLFYGALLGMNWGEACRRSHDMPQAIIDATEFQCDLLMKGLRAVGECNGYDTIYQPLQEVLRNWGAE